VMSGIIVQPVERATVCATRVKTKTASMSMSKESKELQGTVTKMEAYLNCVLYAVLLG
jgi:hypothetical protein